MNRNKGSRVPVYVVLPHHLQLYTQNFCIISYGVNKFYLEIDGLGILVVVGPYKCLFAATYHNQQASITGSIIRPKQYLIIFKCRFKKNQSQNSKFWIDAGIIEPLLTSNRLTATNSTSVQLNSVQSSWSYLTNQLWWNLNIFWDRKMVVVAFTISSQSHYVPHWHCWTYRISLIGFGTEALKTTKHFYGVLRVFLF